MTTSATLSPPESLYRASNGRVDVVDVPDMLFAAVDGEGSPEGTAFQSAIGALFSLAYGVRFALRSRGVNEKVAPLEGLWSPEEMHSDSANWSWRLMIRLPDATDESLEHEVRAEVARRHPERASALDRVTVARWHEGLVVQTLHVGPYATEPATIELLRAYIAAHGYQASGRHHEIYLGDPRRCAPERLRTILRQPVAPAPS